MGSRTWLFGALAGLAILAGCGAKRLVRQGDQWLSQDQPAAAERAFRQAIVRRPGDAELQARLARALLAQDRPDMALEPATRATEAGVEEGEDLLVQTLLALGKVDQAQERVERRLRQDPQSARFLLHRAHIRMFRGDAQGAVTAIDEALAWESTPRTLAFRAWALAMAGSFTEAIPAAEKAELQGSSDPEVLADAAAVYFLGEKHDLRKNAVAALQTLKVDAAQDYWRQAARRESVGDREMALRMVTRAVACDPSQGPWLRHLGEIFLARRSPALAVRYLLAALQADPFNIDVETQILARETPKVVTIGRQPEEVEAILGTLALAYDQRGDLPRAALMRERAAQLNGGEDLSAWLAAGTAWLKASDYNRAMEIASRILRQDPRYPEAQLLMSRVRAARGEADLALGHAQLGWRADPGNPEVARVLGPLLESVGDLAGARAVYDATLELHPTDTTIRAMRDRLAR